MTFSERLLKWFDQHGRKDLPWQIDKTPYRVWVSEIMLQQTQVATVIDYYLRFMQSFPDIHALASASEDKVLEHWSGLGYYARARNLHKAAKIVSHNMKGEFPSTFDEAVALPGIGRSTAGAILSIAFKQRSPILDGNVKRVLCRYFAIENWPGERNTENKLWELAEQLTPKSRTDDYTQAIMDLGATLCSRSKPKCNQCPMTDRCLAYEQNLQSTLPTSKPKKAIPLKKTLMLLIQGKQGLMLEKRPPSGIWGGLYSLPELTIDAHSSAIINECKQLSDGTYTLVERHTPFTHTFSHYKLEIHPVRLLQDSSKSQIQSEGRFHWFHPDDLSTIGMPAPVSNFLANLYDHSDQLGLLRQEN